MHLIASVAPELVERGLKAGEIVKQAAADRRWWRWRAGHAGAGRRTRPERLDEAIAAGRAAIEAALAPG